jgi:hypothetical protein
MERRCPHRPDTEKLRRRLDRAPRGLGIVETTLGEGRGDRYIVNSGVAAVRTGQDDQAAELLAELRRMGPRGAPPIMLEADAAEAGLAAAVLAGDQAEVDAAAAAYSAAWLRFGGRSSSSRARWTFLLNVPALVLMSAAVRRGLTATPGLPDVPPELIQ